MSSTTTKSAFWAGCLASLPFLLVGTPFAMLFGIIATEAGLSVVQAIGMSVVVIAGAAQFTAVQLMTETASVWAVLVASLAVNLRMAMYSASLQPHLGAASFWNRVLIAYLNVDVSYALGILEFEERPDRPLHEKVAYFVGSMVLVAPSWILGTAIGAFAGEVLADAMSIDFMMPVAFLAVLGPMLKTLAHLGAAITATLASLLLVGLPSGTGILIAGLLAMIVGAEIERRRS